MTSPPIGPDVGEHLAARTLELVNVPSVSGEETAILRAIGELLPGDMEVIDRGDGVLFAARSPRRSGSPFVVFAGHVDTVPANGNMPGSRDGGSIRGRGSADMKGALAIMLETAEWIGTEAGTSDLDVGVLFFGREELPIAESALLPLFDRCEEARSIDLAIVMEPTANTIQMGCMGNLNARVIFRGSAAHTARPWLGRNAAHAAIETLASIAGSSPRDVDIDGLIFREVVSVTSIKGGLAGNVVPDRMEARVNMRYAPTRSPADAEAQLRELVSHPEAEIEVIGNAPPGPVRVTNPLVDRLRAAGDLLVGPKQAWTPVAEFGTIGVDAVNFGPGDPQYAHRDDERIELSALVRSYEVLRAFVAAQEVG